MTFTLKTFHAINLIDWTRFVGYMYLLGQGVEVDYPKAKKFFESALSFKPDLINALYHIGLIYELGLGVPADPAKATQFYNKTKDVIENRMISLHITHICISNGGLE